MGEKLEKDLMLEVYIRDGNKGEGSDEKND